MASRQSLRLGTWEGLGTRVQIVERKGLGHPDTLCDALAEEFSRGLSRYYLQQFGEILHHNVDKALLRGGSARAAFGGGDITEPIEIFLAGRATTRVDGHEVPVETIAVEGSKAWLSRHLPELDVERHVKINVLVRSGSSDLTELFARGRLAARGTSSAARDRSSVLANDTSFGVGYAPLSDFERLVLSIEGKLNSDAFVSAHPAGGRDVKLMGVRDGEATSLTIARAFIGRHLDSAQAYADAKAVVEATAREVCLAAQPTLDEGQLSLGVNVADDMSKGSYYLTVTGTSAEAGDDGEVGRGNRANGLITPARPMSLEALAGKNPVSHVGKLYNLVAREIAERIVAELEAVEQAAVYLVSAIGRPIDDPEHIRVDLTTRDETPPERFRAEVDQFVSAHLGDLPELSRRLVEGGVGLY